MQTVGYCPYCHGENCEHFLGWTDDGRRVDEAADGRRPCRIRTTDRIVTTGVSARVYRLSQAERQAKQGAG